MAEGLLNLLRGVRSKPRKLAAGELLFRAGDPVQALFHVEQGCIRLIQGGTTLHMAEAGQSFAESALFSEAYPCDAVAETHSQVQAFAKTAVLLLLKAHPDLNLAFSAYLARQLHRLRGNVQLTRLKGAEARVLTYLSLAGAADGAITLAQPLTQMAWEIGLTREALYRTLGKLEK
ncbi:MAG: Crp/Fnr family transcriptional regulator, partial [Magnetospirillum sp.]|nr:Crp/Fnr family transcriptional regulator [Magnetospirillum sp.]